MFCWKGRRVVIYNHYDSYPSVMGAELFRQLVALLQRFRGDATRASQTWGELVASLRTTDSQDEAANPFNATHAFEDVEAALRSTLPLLCEEDDELDEWIEFVWTIDLNEHLLTMKAHSGRAEWSFAHLYRGRRSKDEWVKEAENAAYQNEDSDADFTETAKKPFKKAVASGAAVQIQASARRFLEVSRGLRPGGVLAKLAATRFRRASGLLHATNGSRGATCAR